MAQRHSKVFYDPETTWQGGRDSGNRSAKNEKIKWIQFYFTLNLKNY